MLCHLFSLTLIYFLIFLPLFSFFLLFHYKFFSFLFSIFTLQVFNPITICLPHFFLLSHMKLFLRRTKKQNKKKTAFKEMNLNCTSWFDHTVKTAVTTSTTPILKWWEHHRFIFLNPLCTLNVTENANTLRTEIIYELVEKDVEF